jgi:hypothetical protein
MMTGDEHHEPLTTNDGLFERTIDRSPGAVEAHSMEVDNAVRGDRSAAETLFPTPI